MSKVKKPLKTPVSTDKVVTKGEIKFQLNGETYSLEFKIWKEIEDAS